MPVNTRKKSVSLADLGITLPKRARAPSASQTQPSPPATVIEDEPISKKPKWSHGATTPPPQPITTAATATATTTCSMSPPDVRIKTEPPSRLAEHTPPPSPGASNSVSGSANTIDTDGIKDDVVVGTIRQLEKTGNRPHLVKELAAILCHNIAAVEKSANPANLISSRLTSYLNRTWPTISPCPLAKYQSTVHPRPLYYFLTTTPHQPIPDMNHVHESILAARRIISPSLSSAADDEDHKYSRHRHDMSPSPEVNLSSPELDDEEPSPDMTGSFNPRGSLPRDHPPTSTNLSHNRRADSPPLEREERDFKQTANALQELRRSSRDSSIVSKSPELDENYSVAMSIEYQQEESEESMALRHHQDAAALFANHDLSSSVSTIYEFSSPMLMPFDRSDAAQVGVVVGQDKMLAPPAWHAKPDKQHTSCDAMIVDHAVVAPQATDVWNSWADGELTSPENVEFDELECLFDF